MKLRILCTLLVAAFSADVYSFDNSSCKLDPQDPFSPDVRMTQGKYKGQCIDTSTKRAIQFLEDFTGEITVANFRHNGKFYMAHIPVQNIKQINYVVVDLNPKLINNFILVNHTQLRVKMQPNAPVRLFPQYGNSQEKVADVFDFLISYNYMAPKGVEYDPLKGLNEERFSAVLQMYDFQDEIKSRKNSKRNLYEFRLNLFDDEAARIVENAIHLSQKLQYSDAYDSWTNNCTTRLFEILDLAVPPASHVRPFKFTAAEIKDTGLYPALKALDDRNLLSIDTELKLINEEFDYSQFSSKKNKYFNKFKGKILPELLDTRN